MNDVRKGESIVSDAISIAILFYVVLLRHLVLKILTNTVSVVFQL